MAQQSPRTGGYRLVSTPERDAERDGDDVESEAEERRASSSATLVTQGAHDDPPPHREGGGGGGGSAAAAGLSDSGHESDSDGETSRMILSGTDKEGGAAAPPRRPLAPPPPPMMPGCCCWRSTVRYQLAFVTFLCSMVCYGQRVGIAVAIVRMQVDMDWDRELQGQILAAFFFGYVLMQMPGGFIATRVGPRRSA